MINTHINKIHIVKQKTAKEKYTCKGCLLTKETREIQKINTVVKIKTLGELKYT